MYNIHDIAEYNVGEYKCQNFIHASNEPGGCVGIRSANAAKGAMRQRRMISADRSGA